MRHKRVLEYVNRVRKALGYKPRKTLAKGVVAHCRECPIARSMPQYVRCRVDKIYFSPNFIVWEGIKGRTITLPTYITDFITEFDDGKYPELIKKEKL